MRTRSSSNSAETTPTALPVARAVQRSNAPDRTRTFINGASLMTNRYSKLTAAFALGTTMTLVGLSACTANIHDNQVEGTVNIDAKISFSAEGDLENLKPDDTVTVNAKPENVDLIEPTETPPPDRAKKAGHLRYYIDNYDDAAVLVTGKASMKMKLPSSIKPGKHKLLCRVHQHDGTPTTATYEITITIVITVTGGGTDAGADTGPSVDAGGDASK